MVNRYRLLLLILIAASISCSGITERSMNNYLPLSGNKKWFFKSENESIEIWQTGGDTIINNNSYRILFKNGYPSPYIIKDNNVYFLFEDTVISNGEVHIYNRERIPLWPSVFVDGFKWHYEKEDSVLRIDKKVEIATTLEGQLNLEENNQRYKATITLIKNRESKIDTFNYEYIFAPDTGIVYFKEESEYTLYQYEP